MSINQIDLTNREKLRKLLNEGVEQQAHVQQAEPDAKKPRVKRKTTRQPLYISIDRQQPQNKPRPNSKTKTAKLKARGASSTATETFIGQSSPQLSAKNECFAFKRICCRADISLFEEFEDIIFGPPKSKATKENIASAKGGYGNVLNDMNRLSLHHGNAEVQQPENCQHQQEIAAPEDAVEPDPTALLSYLHPKTAPQQVAAQVQRPEQQPTSLPMPPPGANTTTATIAQQQEPLNPPPARSLEQSKLEDDALIALECPPELQGVYHMFAKQQEAFACADEINISQPMAPRPTLMQSKILSGQRRQQEEEHNTVDAMEIDGHTVQQQGRGMESATGNNALDLDEGLVGNTTINTNTAGISGQKSSVRALTKAQMESIVDPDKAAMRKMQSEYSNLIKLPYQQGDPTAAPITTNTTVVIKRRGAVGQEENFEVTEYEPPPRRIEAVLAFCVERASTNGHFRNFATATYPAVWRQYRLLPPWERHWYEIVREGRPCHLYFDLEYQKEHNPAVDGNLLVDKLVTHVMSAFRRHYDVQVKMEHIFELDSSTDVKFSRHLIIRVPGYAFCTNIDMGRFVTALIQTHGAEFAVRSSKGDEITSFIDTAVYSRNRHFRMAFSCKGGKNAVLRPTRRFAWSEGPPSPGRVFLDTMVCRVDVHSVLLQMGVHSIRGGSGGGTVTGNVSYDGGLRITWKYDAEDAAAGSDAQQKKKEIMRLAEAGVAFIDRAATERAGGLEARARTAAFCGYDGTVAYSMIGPGSHYCDNIRRAHTSNHVYYVANFATGTYMQKCHDPSCARFRSITMPLPPELHLKPS